MSPSWIIAFLILNLFFNNYYYQWNSKLFFCIFCISAYIYIKLTQNFYFNIDFSYKIQATKFPDKRFATLFSLCKMCGKFQLTSQADKENNAKLPDIMSKVSPKKTCENMLNVLI